MVDEVRKAVIPAAGLGTRFLPATKVMPKEMLPIVDKPVIQYVVEEAVDAGIDDIIIVTGRGKRSVEDHFDRNIELEQILHSKEDHDSLAALERIEEMATIHYVRQKTPKGLGHAVLCAKHHVDGCPFVVLLGDTIVHAHSCTKPLIHLHQKYDAPVIGVEEVPEEMVSQYGIVAGDAVEDGVYRITQMVEKPKREEAPSNLAIFGRYLLTPDVFDCLEKTPPGRGDEIQLTDGMELLRQRREMYAYVIRDKRYDIGKRMLYFKAFVEFAMQRDDIGGEVREYLRGLKA